MKRQATIICAISALTFFGCGKSKSPDVTPTPTSGVSTYAGNGTPGLQNGGAGSAEFNGPVDLALDLNGNLYVSDQGNNVIRKIDAGGNVTTLAGDGTAGYKNDVAAKAQFNGPQGLAIDNVGNVYVADAGNHVIRKIGVDGNVTTYAGDGTAGYKDGTAASAEFSLPNGLAVDKSRNIYVADYGNHVIRKITSGGTVSTFAGSGTPGSGDGAPGQASFRNPSGLTIDQTGNLFVAETANNDIRMITTSGQVSTYAGGLKGPTRLATDGGGNIYYSAVDNTIQWISATGTKITYAGTGTLGFVDGPLLTAQFNTPLGVIVDGFGRLAVADYNNNRIRIVTP
jgi:sugar lactone lactonase YvrE